MAGAVPGHIHIEDDVADGKLKKEEDNNNNKKHTEKKIVSHTKNKPTRTASN